MEKKQVYQKTIALLLQNHFQTNKTKTTASVYFRIFFESEIKGEQLRPAKKEFTQFIPANKLKILLVEDNNVNQMVATRMLQRIGYIADIASNGREAIEALENINYDLIFMDISMPEMDGLTACSLIRSNKDLKKTTGNYCNDCKCNAR